MFSLSEIGPGSESSSPSNIQCTIRFDFLPLFIIGAVQYIFASESGQIHDILDFN